MFAVQRPWFLRVPNVLGWARRKYNYYARQEAHYPRWLFVVLCLLTGIGRTRRTRANPSNAVASHTVCTVLRKYVPVLMLCLRSGVVQTTRVTTTSCEPKQKNNKSRLKAFVSPSLPLATPTSCQSCFLSFAELQAVICRENPPAPSPSKAPCVVFPPGTCKVQAVLNSTYCTLVDKSGFWFWFCFVCDRALFYFWHPTYCCVTFYSKARGWAISFIYAYDHQRNMKYSTKRGCASALLPIRAFPEAFEVTLICNFFSADFRFLPPFS